MTSTSRTDTGNLVALIQGGDKQAFAQLYDSYSAALFGVSLKIVKTHEAAEDVVQDAFVKIWKNINSFDSSKGTIFTWMLNITRNTAIDRLRKSQNLSKAKIQTESEHVSNPEMTSVTFNTNKIGLSDEVDKLDAEHRLMIEYIYFNGYTQQEVSDELNIPLGTVKTRVRKAVSELRKVFTTLFFWI